VVKELIKAEELPGCHGVKYRKNNFFFRVNNGTKNVIVSGKYSAQLIADRV
jgi:hypothetical protein